MTYTRKTVAQDVKLAGLGLHSGVPVEVTIRPGSEGIAFRLGATRWQAIPENVSDTTRCTRLGDISTIEHLMSAFCGLEVTDAEVELSAAELPALDGSSTPYSQALMAAGFETRGQAEIGQPFSRVFLQDLPVKIAISKGEGQWRYEFRLDDHFPGEQDYDCPDVVASYATQIAPARTFALAEEVPAVLQAGLAKGLDIEKALIIGMEGYKNEPRFPDEPARHKLLDLMGDLYLAGVPARLLNVVAERSGHRTNVEAARMLHEAVTHVT